MIQSWQIAYCQSGATSSERSAKKNAAAANADAHPISGTGIEVEIAPTQPEESWKTLTGSATGGDVADLPATPVASSATYPNFGLCAAYRREVQSSLNESFPCLTKTP
jgi:hypothetical protein